MAVIKKIKATNGTTYDIEPANVTETSKKYLHKTTSNAAPNAHTHTVTATGSVSLGSNTTATSGVEYVEKITGGTSVNVGSSTHTHNYDKTTGVTLTANSATDTGRITYVESVSGGSAVSATPRYMKFTAGTTPKSGATPNHTSTASAANTDSGIDAITGYPDFDGGSGSFSPTTKYLSAAPSNESKTTGNNSGTKVTAITGYPNFSGGSLGGTKTFVTGVNGGSGNLEAYDAATGGTKKSTDGSRIKYVHAQGTITGASYTPAGSVSLTNGTAPSMGAATTKYLSAAPSHTSTNTGANSGSAIAAYTSVTTAGSISATRTTSGSGTSVRRTLTLSHTDPTFGTTNAAPNAHTHTYDKTTGITLTANDGTGTGRIQYVHAQGTFTAGTTPKSSASFSGTAATITPTLGNPTYYYLEHTHNPASSSGTGTVTYTAASLGTPSTGDAAPHTHTHSYDKATGVTLTANDSTGTGRIKYIQEATHSHTGASLGDPSTGNAAPNGHTHNYDKTTSVSLTAGTAPSMNFNTGSTSDAKYIYDVTGGSAVTPTTKYLSAAPSNTSTATGTPSATESVATAITPTTKYFHPSFSGTSATTGANSGSAVSAVTNITSNTTATDGIGYITDEE